MKKNLGITLIELLVVMVIIGILALIAYAGLSGAREQAKVATVKASMDSLIPAAEVHYLVSGYTYSGFTCPSTISDACKAVYTDCTCTEVAGTATTWSVTCSATGFTWTCENNGTKSWCYKPTP